MRPIDKGSIPTWSGDYSGARQHLLHRLGKYCSYCELQLNTGLHVEHVESQHSFREKANDWTNFLLACVHCNSTKRYHLTLSRADCIWADQDNTFLALEQPEFLPPQPSSALTPSLRPLVEKVLEVTGLNRLTGPRQDQRYIAWSKALDYRGHLTDNDTPKQRQMIVDFAIETGFWSVWMTVFAADADMKKRLIEAFPGTELTCFDPRQDYEPINRPGGRI